MKGICWWNIHVQHSDAHNSRLFQADRWAKELLHFKFCARQMKKMAVRNDSHITYHHRYSHNWGCSQMYRCCHIYQAPEPNSQKCSADHMLNKHIQASTAVSQRCKCKHRLYWHFPNRINDNNHMLAHSNSFQHQQQNALLKCYSSHSNKFMSCWSSCF